MRSHANTLFITTQGAYLTRDHQTLRVKIEGKVRLTVPLHHLESVVCFGRVSVSPAVLVAYQERKREEVTHPFLNETVPVGLLPHLQARLLARTLRGDLDDYPALVLK